MATRYDNPTKQTWRGWQWNQVRSRISRSNRKPLAVALAGDTAEDLRHANKHGIECVAVDNKMRCVKNFRKAGGLASQADLHDYLIAIQPTILLADLTTGVTPDALAMMLDAIGFCDSVAFNFQRGRDRGIRQLSGVVPQYRRQRERVDVPIGKHRGKISLAYVSRLVAEAWYGVNPGQKMLPADVSEDMFQAMKPEYESYKSKDGGNYFDSIVLTTAAFRLQGGEAKRLEGWASAEARSRAGAAKACLTKRRRHKNS